MSSPTNKTTEGKRSYEKLSNEFVLEHLMGYYEAPSEQSFQRYCTLNGIFHKRQALQYTAGKIGLEALKKDNVPPSHVTDKIALHLNIRKKLLLHSKDALPWKIGYSPMMRQPSLSAHAESCQ